jgi:hypothetical protein
MLVDVQQQDGHGRNGAGSRQAGMIGLGISHRIWARHGITLEPRYFACTMRDCQRDRKSDIQASFRAIQ